MRKLLATSAIALLVMTACGGDDPPRSANETTPPGGTAAPTGASPAAETGPTSAPGFPNVEIPRVSPDPPGPGESTAIELKIEGSAGDPMSQNGAAPRPAVFLARSAQEAEVIAKLLPPRAAEIARSWNAYGKRALVIVTGGPQPDASYRVNLQAISVIQGGKVLTASGEITAKGGAAGQVITVPWVVASVNYAAVVLTERCVLSMAGTTARQSRCHGAR